MKQPMLALALSSAALLVGATAFAGSAAAAPPPEGEPGWVACAPSGAKLTYKPKMHLLACGDANSGLRKLVWSSWTDDKAEATGRYYWNDCEPACATGQTYTSPATVDLKRVRTQHGAEVFTRVVIHYTDADGHPAIERQKALSWMG